MRAMMLLSLTGLLGCLAAARTAEAIPPLRSLLSFERVEADPNQSYELTEDQGPWMILAASFTGEGAQADAHALALELRREFGLPAYLHSKQFDYTEPVHGRGLNRYGEPIQARYAHAARIEQVAVLVGDYPSVDDRDLEHDLERLKHARPQSLNPEGGQGTSLVFSRLRTQLSQITGDERGPMGSAFAVPNPKLPPEYFTHQGIDPLVLEMNEDVDYSLLDCPGEFTVQVSRFRGSNTIQQDLIDEIEAGRRRLESRLVEAAEKAHLMAKALREQGVEAYEYHDLRESVVCVGSFDSLYVLDPRQPYVVDEQGHRGKNYVLDAQGRPILNPAILEVINGYAPEQAAGPNGAPMAGNQPRTIRVADGRTLIFDSVPLPIVVPKRSIGDAYARRSGGLFSR